MTAALERSVPRLEFTDAEAGAREFADSDAREYNYFEPAKRRQTQYEDVTVDVQPDPRHHLAQGWLYSFADGRGGYPVEWTALKAAGTDIPLPERGPGSGATESPWGALAWHRFRDPNENWEMTFYRTIANVVRQLNQNIETARETKAFSRWHPNWVDFVAHHVGAWMHVDHGLGMHVFVQNQRRAPTNMHNNVIAVNGMHLLRAAQDLALYNLTLTEEIESFDGTAHLLAWNGDNAWQGVRETVEQLTATKDWAEAIFAANMVFQPLVGDLFRSRLVLQAAAEHGDFVTPTLMSAEEFDFERRDLRYMVAMLRLLIEDEEYAADNRALMQSWLSTWVPRCLDAARRLQPLWSRPVVKPVRFEDGLDLAKSRFTDVLSRLDLETPKELTQ